MKLYHLFWDSKRNAPEVVKSGFSFWAFVFTFFYPAFKGHWKTALTFFLGSITLSIVSLLAFDEGSIFSLLSNFAFSLYVGFDYAECAFGECYKNENMSFMGSEFAHSFDQAEALAFEKYMHHS